MAPTGWDHPFHLSIAEDPHRLDAAPECMKRQRVFANVLKQHLHCDAIAGGVGSFIHTPESSARDLADERVVQNLVLSRLGSHVPRGVDRVAVRLQKLLVLAVGFVAIRAQQRGCVGV
jgi:hypothetical protein